MGIDIRIPIGGMFGILGVLLVIYGLMTSGDAMYERSLGINANLWWGLVMMLFSGTMLALSRRKKAEKPATSSAVDNKDRRPMGH